MKNNHQRAARRRSGLVRRCHPPQYRIPHVRQTDQLTGAGVALTLTLRDCPPTADDWHKLRRAWEKRMVRAGMVRLHWVTEWQRRGVPHLHCAIWFPDAYDTITPTRAWVEVASAYGAGLRGQHARIIDGPVGWFQYLAKHAARGVKHYQRTADSIPEGWQKDRARVGKSRPLAGAGKGPS